MSTYLQDKVVFHCYPLSQMDTIELENTEALNMRKHILQNSYNRDGSVERYATQASLHF